MAPCHAGLQDWRESGAVPAGEPGRPGCQVGQLAKASADGWGSGWRPYRASRLRRAGMMPSQPAALAALLRGARRCTKEN